MGGMQDTRETIMAVARATVQAHGYGGLSFRELARAVGIKSASIHYHFPAKADLGAALARRYHEDARAAFEGFLDETPDMRERLRRYVATFRLALENGNRMCMCGQLAAEYDDLPEPVRAEVRAFADVNTAWLARVLAEGGSAPAVAEARALAIYAAVGGAQLAARGRGDVAVFDAIMETYRDSGLIPG